MLSTACCKDLLRSAAPRSYMLSTIRYVIWNFLTKLVVVVSTLCTLFCPIMWEKKWDANLGVSESDEKCRSWQETFSHYFQALRSRYEGRTREEAFHLVKARHWSLGHNVVLRSLVSDAIINGKKLKKSFNYNAWTMCIVIQRFIKFILSFRGVWHFEDLAWRNGTERS